MKIAVYPGTFDPITNGHLDILKQALMVFDTIYVAVAPNVRKTPLFSVQERINLIKLSVDSNRVPVISSDELTVALAKRIQASAIVRGIRAGADFEAESQMALMNRHLAPDLCTVCFFPGEPNTYISSSLIKEVARFGGDVVQFVPQEVARRLTEKFQNKS